jgi:hypothetical protein
MSNDKDDKELKGEEEADPKALFSRKDPPTLPEMECVSLLAWYNPLPKLRRRSSVIGITP